MTTSTYPSDPSIGTLIARARTADRSPSADAARSGPIRVLFADDSYLIREALQEVLAPVDAVDLVGAFADGDSLLNAIDADPPDVVIADIRMPPTGDDEGIRVARRLRETHPEIGVVVLSQYAGSRYALALLEGGLERAMQAGKIGKRPTRPLAHLLLGALDEAAMQASKREIVRLLTALAST